jgi:hypothetical protein
MMKNLPVFSCFLLCSLFFATASLSQDDYTEAWRHSYGDLQGREAGDTCYTLASDVNVRQSPGTQSPVVTKLPIATPVRVEEVATDSLTLKGIRMPWLRVSFTEGNTQKQGYVWGGFMATAFIQVPDEEAYANRGVVFLAGPLSYDEKKHQMMLQVRAAKGGKELAKADFATVGDVYYSPEFTLETSVFRNVQAVLSLNYSYPACGYASGNNLLFWRKNGSLSKVLETSSAADGGVFYQSETFLLPYDKGGIAEHILVTEDTAEMKETPSGDYEIASQKVKVTLHKWNGSQLVKLKGM